MNMGIFFNNDWTTWTDANGVVWGGYRDHGRNAKVVEIPAPDGGRAHIFLRGNPIKVYDPAYPQSKGYRPFSYPDTWIVTDDKTGERTEVEVPRETIVAMWVCDIFLTVMLLAAIVFAVVLLA
jgi:hypothetical protein